MRFHQIYDELPPLFQMLTKVLSVATGKGYFKIPRYVVWETLNDLIAKGVEANTFSIVLDELVDMFLLKIEFEGDENVLSFRHPALGNIAYEVCTPVQIAAIRRALLERLEPVRSMNFRVPLVMAQLYHDLREQEETKKELWRSSYEAFKAESAQYSERETRKWMELIEDEIEAAGYQACDIVGDGVRVLCPPIDAVPHTLPLLKIYSAPVAFGPMGHSLSVITRNTFHEWGAFHGAKKDAIASLRTATASAAKRYLREVALVEGLLSEYKFGLEEEDARKERSIIQFLAKPAVSTDNVKLKARRILEEFVPQVVESRLKRLHLLIEELRKQEAPDFIRRTSAPIKKAYFCLKSNEEKCRQDSAQHALMILATMNWKPRRVPEYLPLVHYQTVANVRNKTLTRLSKAEAIIFRHQQKIDDLECFLVLTALL